MIEIHSQIQMNFFLFIQNILSAHVTAQSVRLRCVPTGTALDNKLLRLIAPVLPKKQLSIIVFLGQTNDSRLFLFIIIKVQIIQYSSIKIKRFIFQYKDCYDTCVGAGTACNNDRKVEELFQNNKNYVQEQCYSCHFSTDTFVCINILYHPNKNSNQHDIFYSREMLMDSRTAVTVLLMKTIF